MENKPHISASSIDTYNRCPEQWRRRYVEGHKIPPGIALIRGTAVHKGAEHNFKQKIESKVDLPKQEVIDVSCSTFEDVIRNEGLELTLDQRAEGRDKVIGKAKDSVAALTGLLSDEVAHDIQPVAVEEEIRIKLPNATRDLLGYLDIRTQDSIDDIKTAGKSKWASEAGTHTQFILYSLMYKAKTGTDPGRVNIHELVSGGKPKYNKVSIKFSTDDYEPLVRRINATLKGIDGGFFPPATPGAWWCSPNSCGYWVTCPYVNSGRKAAYDSQKKSAAGIADYIMPTKK